MHTHSWIEIRRTYTPLPDRKFTVKFASEDLLQRFFFGLTVVELKCSGCGDIRFRETNGKSE
jgi:hypothetical protein